MYKKNLGLLAGLITLAVAVLSFNSYLSPTSHAVHSGSAGSLFVSIVTLIVALALFSKYFNLFS